MMGVASQVSRGVMYHWQDFKNVLFVLLAGGVNFQRGLFLAVLSERAKA